MEGQKILLIVNLIIYLTLCKNLHNNLCPFSIIGSENNAGSGYRSNTANGIYFKKIDNVLSDPTLKYTLSKIINKKSVATIKVQLKNPQRIFLCR